MFIPIGLVANGSLTCNYFALSLYVVIRISDLAVSGSLYWVMPSDGPELLWIRSALFDESRVRRSLLLRGYVCVVNRKTDEVSVLTGLYLPGYLLISLIISFHKEVNAVIATSGLVHCQVSLVVLTYLIHELLFECLQTSQFTHVLSSLVFQEFQHQLCC